MKYIATIKNSVSRTHLVDWDGFEVIFQIEEAFEDISNFKLKTAIGIEGKVFGLATTIRSTDIINARLINSQLSFDEIIKTNPYALPSEIYPPDERFSLEVLQESRNINEYVDFETLLTHYIKALMALQSADIIMNGVMTLSQNDKPAPSNSVNKPNTLKPNALKEVAVPEKKSQYAAETSKTQISTTMDYIEKIMKTSSDPFNDLPPY